MSKGKSQGLWTKVSVDYYSHPKVMAACTAAKSGADPAILNLAAQAYSRKHANDGRVPASMLAGLAPMVRRPKVCAKALVDAGLWRVEGDHFVIHDYEDWNPTKAEITDQREKWKEEKRQQRSRNVDSTDVDVRTGHLTGQSDGQETGHPSDINTDPHARGRHAHSPSDSETGSGLEMEGGAGETVRSRGASGRSVLTDGRWNRKHAEHQHFPSGCLLDICVLPDIATQLENRLSVCGGKGRDGRTAAQFFADEIAAHQASGEATGETPWRFWSRRIELWLGAPPRAAAMSLDEQHQRRALGPQHGPLMAEDVEALLDRCEPPVARYQQAQYFHGATLDGDCLRVAPDAVSWVNHHYLDRLSAVAGRRLRVDALAVAS